MPWKPEYQENRKRKYQEDEEYREKVKKQSVGDPEKRREYQREYMKKYYHKHKEDKREERKRKRYERYRNDPEYRKRCIEHSKKQTAKDPEKKKSKRYQRTYGITLEEFKSLIDEREGRCDICGGLVGVGIKELYVDHCHSTGMLRGLLCVNCNFGIGHFQDDPRLLKKAAKYLKRAEKKMGMVEIEIPDWITKNR